MKISVSTGIYYTKNYLEILDMIKETSCRNIELFLNQSFIDVPINELHKRNILKYKEVTDFYITTENLPCFRRRSFLAKHMEFTRFIKDNNVNITFDTTHCAANNLSILELYEELKKHIKNIHLSDFNDGEEHKILGHGQMPLKQFLTDLKNDKYNEIITIELDFDNKKRNYVEGIKQASKEIEKSITFIRKYTTV